MAIDETTTATLDPEVLYTKLDDGEAVLLHLGTTTYYTLNQTGARIWKLLGDGHSVQDVHRPRASRCGHRSGSSWAMDIACKMSAAP